MTIAHFKNRFIKSFTSTAFLIVFYTQTGSAQNVYYVKEGASGTGTSWIDANGDLQDVINNASLGDSIFVAEGTYKPNRKANDLTTITPNNKDNAFVLKNGVKLFGGFPSTGTPGMVDRDWDNFPTILSGDFLDNDIISGSGATLSFMNHTENACHVVIAAGNSNETEFNGFIVKNGNADQVGPISVNGYNIYKQKGGGFYSISSVSVIRNVKFVYNKSHDAAGLLIFESTISTVENCVFENNYSGWWGGGMYTDLSSPSIDNCIFENNYAAQYGGGMFNNNNSSPIVANSSFVSNTSNIGGAMRNSNSSYPQIVNTIFSNNYGNSNAGAIVNLSYSNAIITHSTFENNTATGNGGAILNFLSSMEIDSSLFVNNQAEQGGAMQNESASNLIITNSIFENNVADYGGAMTNFDSSPVIENSVFESNNADEGGAIFNYLSSPVITNSNFEANTAVYYGGAIRNYDNSSPVITNVIFEHNSSTDYGGAINNYLNSSPIILDAVFSNNSAIHGGAISNYENASPTITNTLIHHNSATYGGGIYNFLNSNADISSSTIAFNNSDQGGGLYNDDASEPIIKNTIILGNIASIADTSIYNSTNSSYISYFSLIEGVQNTVNGNIDASNIEADEIFNDVNNNDFSLLLTCGGNPAIDAGSNVLIPAGILTDIIGNIRIYGDSTDLGAYEVNTNTNDTTAPIADVTTLSDITAICQVNSLTAPTATDNCAGAITATHDATLPITSQGTTVVTWTYDDGNGNTSTQTQSVIIDDVTDPIADVATLSDVTAECEVTSLTAPTATDNCAGVITGTHNATLPITAQGTTLVTWTYDDGNGNITNQTQNVIITPIDNGITQVDDITLSADASGYSYQWIDCDNGNTPISGETSQTFVATSNGNYAVEIDNGTCTVTSNCMAINQVGISEIGDSEFIKVYPNPAKNYLIIELPTDTKVELIDGLGKVIEHYSLKKGENQLNVDFLSVGVYYLKLNSSLIQEFIRFVKN